MNDILNYTYILNNSTLERRYDPSNSILSSLRISLVLILRAGFILIQIGSIPTEHSYNIIIQNIVEFSVSTSSYGLIGTLLSFGNKSAGGFVGYGSWNVTNLDLDNVILGFCAVIIGSAIITTFLSGRLHFISNCVLAFIYGGFAQPIILHWIWNINGWMNNVTIFHRKMLVWDHAGSLVVHMSSGLIGLMGLAVLGRRLLRLKAIDAFSLGTESVGMTLTGYIFLIVGLMGFSLPTKKSNLFHDSEYTRLIVVNNLLGLAGGSCATIILEFILWNNTINYWAIIRCIQGCISGLVITAASVDTANPPLTFLFTLIGCLLSGATSKLIYKSPVEDYCNLIPTHLLCGLWATVLQPVTAKLTTIHLLDIIINISFQIICAIVVIIFLSIIYGITFLLLWCTGLLRNTIEDNCHARSLKILKNYNECIFNRLFVVNSVDAILEPGPSGKEPEIVLQVEKKSDRNLKKSSSIVNLFKDDIIGNKIKPTPITQQPAKTEKRRKLKTIHTMHNPLCNAENETPECAGDFNEIYKLDDLIGKVAVKKIDSKKSIPKRVKSKILRKKSHYRLNKSKKYVDLSQNKRMKKPWVVTNIERKINDDERSTDLVNYDRRYNDGITTIKMPAFDQIVSE